MGKAKRGAVDLIALQCSGCKNKNYSTQKNRRNVQEKLQLRKFCGFCRKHTDHREAKIK